MKPDHIGLVEDAKVAIDKVFNDSAVDRATTQESLEELRDEIEAKLDALDALDTDDNE